MSDELLAYLSAESDDSGPPCFWSYAREDDFLINGKLGDVSTDLANFYKFETGKALKIFRDVESLAWGQKWEERVTHGLQNVMFLIPAVTPNFLKSAACRAEIARFEAVCRARGVQNLILPIVFSGRHLLTVDSQDEIAQLIAQTQFTPFDEVWFTSRQGDLWQTSIRKMVLELIKIEATAEEQLNRALSLEAVRAPAVRRSSNPSPGDPEAISRGVPIDIDSLDADPADDDPQLAELIGQLEDDFARITDFINLAAGKFTFVSERIKLWGENPVRPTNAKSATQYFFRLATEVDAPAKEFHRAAAQAYNVALSIDTTIAKMRQIAGEMTDSAVGEAFNATLAQGLGSSADGVRDTVAVVDKLVPEIADVERYSSLLKRSLRPVRSGMQIMGDIGSLMLDWQRSAEPGAAGD